MLFFGFISAYSFGQADACVKGLLGRVAAQGAGRGDHDAQGEIGVYALVRTKPVLLLR